MKVTITDYEEISKKATKKIADEFSSFGFTADPPVITQGMVRIVLEALKEKFPNEPLCILDI